MLIVYSTTLFVRDERLRLIDQQIERSASAILATRLDQEQLEDLDEVEDLLYETLSLEPPNLFVYIFDSKGKILYQNELAKIIAFAPNSKLGWNTTTENAHKLRWLTLALQKNGQHLAVGLVLNRTDEVWERASTRLFAYIFIIFIFTALISFLLTHFLLSPIRKVSNYLTYLSTHVKSLDSAQPQKFRTFFFSEFNDLIKAVEKVKSEIEVVLQDKSLLFSQMTHELKTPLAIILNQVESLPANAKSTLAYSNVVSEIEYLTKTVEEFLDWSYFDQTPVESLETDAVKIGELTERILAVLQPEERVRFDIKAEETFYVFAKMTLLKQVLVNLITNALKYSSGKIEIEIEDHRWSIRDFGPGINPKILEKVGQPFNRPTTNAMKSTGLGLAWINSVCRKYHWKLVIETNDKGTFITIIFPSEKGH